jgi:Xaa-Pro aminopeptidase
MTRAEIQWLDHYHATVLKKLTSKVTMKTKHWLEKACAPLTRKP